MIVASSGWIPLRLSKRRVRLIPGAPAELHQLLFLFGLKQTGFEDLVLSAETGYFIFYLVYLLAGGRLLLLKGESLLFVGLDLQREVKGARCAIAESTRC